MAEVCRCDFWLCRDELEGTGTETTDPPKPNDDDNFPNARAKFFGDSEGWVVGSKEAVDTDAEFIVALPLVMIVVVVAVVAALVAFG